MKRYCATSRLGKWPVGVSIFMIVASLMPAIAWAQMPEVKPRFLPDTTRKIRLQKPDTLISLPQPTPPAEPKVMILERPGYSRVVFGVGSPITFYTHKESSKYVGIVSRVETKAFYLMTNSGPNTMILYQDVRKVIVPRSDHLAGTEKLFGSAMIAAGLGYMALYAINPGAGNSFNLAESSHARNSIITIAALVTSGLWLRWLGRDQRVKPGKHWKFRVDEDNPFYGPQTQK